MGEMEEGKMDHVQQWIQDLGDASYNWEPQELLKSTVYDLSRIQCVVYIISVMTR